MGGEGPLLRGMWGALAPQGSSGLLHRGYSHSSRLRVRNVGPADLSYLLLQWVLRLVKKTPLKMQIKGLH